MFNKKSFIGIIVIVLTMMLIVGCSEIAPNISLELEKKKPDSLPEQALENQQATANVPEQAQADLPFAPAAPEWTKDIVIQHLYDGNDLSKFYTLEPGDTVQLEYNSTNDSEIYVGNKTYGTANEYTVYFTRYIDGVAYGSVPSTLTPDTWSIFDYSGYGIDELTGYTLDSIEPIEGLEHGWNISFVSP